MEGEHRREALVSLLQKSEQPVSGSDLAKKFSVSRQVIVQDIALLRAVNKNILSTNKGYLIYDPAQGASTARRILAVRHSDEQIEEELYVVVDNGGKVLDVVVEHEVYGQITVDLVLKTRQDVVEFIHRIRHSKDKPLKSLTEGLHYHTIEAENSQILDRIESVLKEKGIC